jgi:hypothetical protein
MHHGPASRLQLHRDIRSEPPFRAPSDTRGTATVVHDRHVLFTRQPSLKRTVDGLVVGGHDEELLDHHHPRQRPSSRRGRLVRRSCKTSCSALSATPGDPMGRWFNACQAARCTASHGVGAFALPAGELEQRDRVALPLHADDDVADPARSTSTP